MRRGPTIPLRTAPSVHFAALIGCALLGATPLLLAGQGARSADAQVSRGKPLAEWMVQAEHYIPDLRREAIRAIAALGPGARDALPVLTRATRDEQEEVRFWAVEALRKLGPLARPAVPALLVVLTDDTRRVQVAARAALEAVGPSAMPALLPALRSPDPWVRANAAEALGGMGGGAKVVGELSRMLSDDSLWVRASASWALGRLGGQAKSAAKPLTRLLEEELRRDPSLSDPRQRARVAQVTYALGRMGQHAEGAVPPLVSVLYDGGDSLRSDAGEALAGIGETAAGPLGGAMRNGPMPVRLEAARALRLMGPAGKRAVPDLTRVLQETDELEGGHDLVLATADALGAIGKPARSSLNALEGQRKKSASADVLAALDRAIRKIRTGG